MNLVVSVTVKMSLMQIINKHVRNILSGVIYNTPSGMYECVCRIATWKLFMTTVPIKATSCVYCIVQELSSGRLHILPIDVWHVDEPPDR